MDINTLAAWGEFLGGIGVIASLVYLAGQIRQNSKLVRASTATATAQVHANHVGHMVQDPDVARLYFGGLEDIDSISETDRHRLEALLSIQVQGLIARHDFAEAAFQEAHEPQREDQRGRHGDVLEDADG